MSPISHFLVSWCGFERVLQTRRDRTLVVLAGLAPDLDGLGLIVDFTSRALSLAPTEYYQSIHRHWTHGLTAALVFSVVAAWLTPNRWRVGLCALLAVHLHLLGDLIGARGSMPEDVWGIFYWAPWLPEIEIAWPGQWPLVSWQNFAITASLLALAIQRAWRTGHSPLSLIRPAWDAVFLRSLRQRFPPR